MDELRELIRQEGKKIYIYISKSVKQDPEEEDTKDICFNPCVITGLFNELTSSQMTWKTTGTAPTQGGEIVVDKKYRTMLECAFKIVIDSVTYVGWKDNQGKTQIRQEGNYIRHYVYRK
jgi:hypothetical protein